MPFVPPPARGDQGPRDSSPSRVPSDANPADSRYAHPEARPVRIRERRAASPMLGAQLLAAILGLADSGEDSDSD